MLDPYIGAYLYIWILHDPYIMESSILLDPSESVHWNQFINMDPAGSRILEPILHTRDPAVPYV